MGAKETGNYIYNEKIRSEKIHETMEKFSNLPYKQGKYESRHWGNKRHQLCSYPSKITPSIAYHLVKHFTDRGDIVLDPLAGAGTIPLEACLNGRIGIGSDLSPLAYHITNAKVNVQKKSKVSAKIEDLKDFIETSKLDKIVLEETEDEIKEFFHERTLREIIKARKYLNNIKDSPTHSLLFASISHILHGNRPYALSRRSHNVIPIPPKGEFKYESLINSLTDKVERFFKSQLPMDFKEGKAFQQNILDFSKSPAAKRKRPQNRPVLC
ncbi:hypothetical protein AKJ64_01415 [candidate division MSBL1 archaeon SCGC-AAA259E17]|uniref:DNA methylase N-4/N-6 domain-containing protein n=1 Tax=candidate division MSBL1 archaeon SCGC-AAA259E17 TaxID=1698263 RepID=A0A133UG14_9EURY|nr:hypothetical protein AKJ64_01415 [candidate division MSBL1 archaeon SCGC-AAA259E17]